MKYRFFLLILQIVIFGQVWAQTDSLVRKELFFDEKMTHSLLYLNCANDIRMFSPTLGVHFKPTFESDGAECIWNASHYWLTIVPHQESFYIKVLQGGRVLDSLRLHAKASPEPVLTIHKIHQEGGLPYLDKKTNAVKLQLIANEDEFKVHYKHDAKYKIFTILVSVFYKEELVKQIKVVKESVDVKELFPELKKGSVVKMVVQEAKRRNFRGEMEEVLCFDEEGKPLYEWEVNFK